MLEALKDYFIDLDVPQTLELLLRIYILDDKNTDAISKSIYKRRITSLDQWWLPLK